MKTLLGKPAVAPGEPRVKKRRAKEYDLMIQPRDELRKLLMHKKVTA